MTCYYEIQGMVCITRNNGIGNLLRGGVVIYLFRLSEGFEAIRFPSALNGNEKLTATGQ